MDLIFNKKCPICLEKSGDFFTLSCLHKIHLECCNNLINLKCPLCQEIVKNYPEDIQKNIEKNIISYRKELEEEDREYAARTYSDSYSQIINNIITPQMEIAAAVEYLRDNEIPLICIPEKIEITFYQNQPVPEKGVIFRTIIDTILGYILDHISDYEDDEGFLEEEENPFLFEDLILESRGLNIKIRKL